MIQEFLHDSYIPYGVKFVDSASSGSQMFAKVETYKIHNVNLLLHF